MIFASVPFLFYFLPVLLAVYFCVPQRLRQWRNVILLIFSLIFYAWGEGFFVFMLLAMTGINHVLGRFIARHHNGWLLGIGIVLNLAPLFWYKYAGFAAQTFGADWQGPALLLGISFFTFQAVSYLVDIWRERTAPAPSWLNTALYICAFPQLIAGPIVRYHLIADQIENRRETVDGFVCGIRLFILGLAQKVLLANTLGETADIAFGEPVQNLSVLLAWVGAVCFSLQIYFDFAGYSNMAIGMGRFFGFDYPRNFEFPYIAGSVREFWRRWHITLSNWFRDYLYIPLGGNRRGAVRTYANLVIVFVLCGLWHGAAWTFVLWGLWHGVFLVIERAGLGSVLDRLPRLARSLYLVPVVTLGFVLFRAESLPHALGYFAALFGGNGDPVLTHPAYLIGSGGMAVMALGFLCATPVFKVLTQRLSGSPAAVMAGHAGLFALLLASIVMLAGDTYNPFLYFRF